MIDWEAMKKIRNSKKGISSPEMMWDLACEYFQEVDANPFMKHEQRKVHPKDGTVRTELVAMPVMRPYTWAGFGAFLTMRGIPGCIDHYKYNLNGAYENYKPIVKQIADVMFSQKFEGASVGVFNASLISRDLGLAEKVETKVTHEQPLFGDDGNDSLY